MSEKQKEEALEADNYHAYCFAASNGHIEVLLHLEQRMSEKQQQEALEARDYYAYSSAASDRHIDVLLHLEDRMTKKQKQAAIISLCANDRHVFQASRCRLIFNHLIHFPEFFAWALMVQQEIIESAREKIQSRLWYFAEKQLQKWQKQSALFADNDPNGLFNLAEDEASIALCIAMWLIRIEDAKVTEKLRFLMCIPNVVSCAKEIIKTISGIDAIEECPEKWAREQWRWIDHARNRPEPGGYFYRTDYEHLKRDTWTCIQCLWLLTDFSQLVPWMGQHKKRITTYDADETRLTTRPRTRRYVSEQENADITDELLLNAHLFFSAAASTSPVISEDANDLPLENKACLT